MGKSKGPYNEEFPIGSVVRIIEKNKLEQFMKNWKYHHQLQPEQLEYAGKISKVKKVGFYHGGDELYTLEDIPGLWHEACLEGVNAK